jgi:hypothetical protein
MASNVTPANTCPGKFARVTPKKTWLIPFAGRRKAMGVRDWSFVLATP